MQLFLGLLSRTYSVKYIKSQSRNNVIIPFKQSDIFNAFTWTEEALEYPPMVIGIENCSMNTGSVPSFPGNTKSKRDQSSFRLFCIGEPDKMIRWGVRNYE